MSRSIEREELIAAIAACVSGLEWLEAAWLGGADATGRIDARSDLDLVCLVRDDRVEHTFDSLESLFASLGGIRHRYRVPEPTRHGNAQAYYLLADASDDLSIDLVVLRASVADRLLELERHGEPLVLFDRGVGIRSVPLDREAHDLRLRARYEEIVDAAPILIPLVSKAIDRGFVAEAADSYRNFLLRPLVDLLRMEHCPDRFDFGFRYLDRDLPTAERALIEDLSTTGDLESIDGLRTQAFAVFERQRIRVGEMLTDAL
ncbi:MAG: hypothetical protein CBB69_009420 [Phycisphaera sp. TMED9]|nr:MAG: hypothetical protein CBB69_009420 [Phycisphaera sp. TMED9]